MSLYQSTISLLTGASIMTLKSCPKCAHETLWFEPGTEQYVCQHETCDYISGGTYVPNLPDNIEESLETSTATGEDIAKQLVAMVLNRIKENPLHHQVYLLAMINNILIETIINLAMKSGVETMKDELFKDIKGSEGEH